MPHFSLGTERLILRNWHDKDIESFHAICPDQRVMEFVGPTQSREEVAHFVEEQ